MTNTLHRFGKPEDLKDDYIVFILPSPGINEIGSEDKANDFLRTALKYKPVNLARPGENGPLFRPEKDLNLLKLYFRGRKETVSPEQILKEETTSGMALAVFNNKQALKGFLKEIKEMDLGLSVNVSTLIDVIKEITPRFDMRPHSINYSLGIRGNLYRLPEQQVLALTTMCGHGLISSNFAKKMIDRVKEGRLTPEKAAGYMAKFCVCGAFNPSRAVSILNKARML